MALTFYNLFPHTPALKPMERRNVSEQCHANNQAILALVFMDRLTAVIYIGETGHQWFRSEAVVWYL
jgi:hypothetical protein